MSAVTLKLVFFFFFHLATPFLLQKSQGQLLINVCDMMADYCKQYEGMTVICLLLLATWQRNVGGVQIMMLSDDGRKKHCKYICAYMIYSGW